MTVGIGEPQPADEPAAGAKRLLHERWIEVRQPQLRGAEDVEALVVAELSPDEPERALTTPATFGPVTSKSPCSPRRTCTSNSHVTASASAGLSSTGPVRLHSPTCTSSYIWPSSPGPHRLPGSSLPRISTRMLVIGRCSR